MTFLLIVTVTSMLLAAIMSAIAWRLAGDERRRSDSRVSALSAAIHAAPSPAPAIASAFDHWDSALGHAQLFAPRPVRTGSRPFAIVAAGGLAIAAAVAFVIVFTPRIMRAARPVTQAAAPAARAPQPLELVALRHDRADERLTVSGVVRNAAAGALRITAVVQLFTPDGRFLSSGSAALVSPAPGGESTFAVTMPMPAEAGVGRYRVSFRTDEGVVSHVDRRDEN